MISEISYINIREVLSRVLRHPLLQDVTLEQVIQYTVDFIRIVGCPRIFHERTQILHIKDYRAALPCDYESIIQVRTHGESNHKHEVFRHTTDSFHMSEDKHSSYDLTYKKDPNASSKGKSGSRNSSGSVSTKKVNRLAKPIKIKVGGGNDVEEYGDDVSPSGTRVPFTELTGQAREIAKQYMNDDTSEGYDIYIEEPGKLHSHQRITIIPRIVETIGNEDEDGEDDI